MKTHDALRILITASIGGAIIGFTIGRLIG
jgi:hypothetical protein